MASIYRIARILVISLMAVAISAHAQEVTLEDAKKTLTHAMVEYTKWPTEQTFDAFVIGLYGDDPELREVLVEYMATQEVRGKPILVTTVDSLAAARDVQVLLVSPARASQLAEITETLKGSDTLIVTDGYGDRASTMVNFTHPTKRRVSFEVNAGNIIAAGLTPTRDILVFGGTKDDLAEAYGFIESKLAQADSVSAEQQQRLADQQARIDDQLQLLESQEQRLTEQGEMLVEGATLESQRAEVQANQRKLARLQDQLGSVRKELTASQAQLEEKTAALDQREQALAQKEAELASAAGLASTAADVATIENQPAAAQEPVSDIEPVAAPIPAVQPDTMASESSGSSYVTGGMLILILGLMGLTFSAYRGKQRLASQLEGKTLVPGLANTKLVQLAEGNSRTVLESVELLEDTGLTKMQKEYVGNIATAAGALYGLSKDLHDLSDMEAGHLGLDTVPFTLRDVLGDILQPLALKASDKGLELTFHIPPDIPDGVLGDPRRLRQVMDNLVGNAIEFTNAGEVAVDLKLESSTDDAVQVRFEVRDTGIGIEPEQQQEVLRAFAQVDPDSPARKGATGLGLTVADQLAELMGSRLTVTSEPGQGSTFAFSAAFQLPDGPARAAQKPLSALVVDDNSTNLMILEELLDSWGMSVTAADSGEKALEELERAEAAGDSFAIGLLDVVMPNMDGFELAQRIRERPSQKAMRILMLTSAGQPESAVLKERLDISGVLLKPTKHSELQAAITEALGVRGETVEHTPQVSEAKADPRKLVLVENVNSNREVVEEMFGKRAGLAEAAAEDANSEEVAKEIAEEIAEEIVETKEEVADVVEEKQPEPEKEIVAAAEDLPCLDWDEALRNLEGDEEFLIELASTFLAEYPGMLEAVEQAVAAEEGEELRMAAHALKGPAQLIGAMASADTAMRLENLGHMEKLSEALDELEVLKQGLVDLEAALSAEIPDRDGSEEPANSGQDQAMP